MSTPHNKERYGETWPEAKIKACFEELGHLRPHVALSGGWAWHFLSPVGHVELKHAHDHKDIDIFVPPANVGMVVALLKSRNFERVATIYDRLPSAEDFRRYEKVVEYRAEAAEDLVSVRITIDFFVGDHPSRLVDGWRVVEPAIMLGFYSNIHSSDKCFAVQAAAQLLAQGIDPEGHPDLVAIPE